MKCMLKYIRNNSGATALEFAILAGPLFVAIFATIELSYKGILQTELDDKLYNVAADIAVNNFTADTASEFMQNQFCQDIGTTFLKCEEVEIGIEVMSNNFHTYRNDTMIGRWNMGCANDAILIELNYPMTNIVHPMVIGDIITRNGDQYFRSRGVIRREPLLSGSTTC